MRHFLRIQYGKTIKEEVHDLPSASPARAMKAAQQLMEDLNAKLPAKKRGVLLSIRPSVAYRA